jgi:hypothetical protein
MKWQVPQPAELYRLVQRQMPLLLLVALLVLGGTVLHRQDASEQEFQSNYVLALYGINAGVDFSKRICSGGSVPQGADGSGVGVVETEGVEGADELNTVRSEVDGIMKKLERPSKGNAMAVVKLRTLYGIYSRFQTLALDSLTSTPQPPERIDALHREYVETLAEIRKDLPPQLAKELKLAGAKYNMKFMAQAP